MGHLYNHVCKEHTLYKAWQVVRRSATESDSREIRRAAEDFDTALTRNIRSLSTRLSKRTFSFEPEKAILKKRGPHKSPRPIVLAPLTNRIVDRAILDTVTNAELCPGIAEILSAPNCIGGVRGVDAAIALIKEMLSNSGLWYVRSDIKDFFTHIPRKRLHNILTVRAGDTQFTDLFVQALDIELSNPDDVAKYLHLFPNDQFGVPQGCALSMLAGNLVLHEFDEQMNGRSILCVRYVDDFVLIAPRKRHVEAAFESARAHLQELSLDAYPPDGSSDKAGIGECDEAFTFLGCELAPGRIEPSKASCSSILFHIDTLLRDGLENVRKARDKTRGLRKDRRYYQTMSAVDRSLEGWAKARSFCNRPQRFESVDERVDARLAQFRKAVNRELQHATPRDLRRALGIANAAETPYREPRHPKQ